MCDRENYIQYLVVNYNGKESGEESAHTYKTESLCCPAETNTALLISYDVTSEVGYFPTMHLHATDNCKQYMILFRACSQATINLAQSSLHTTRFVFWN